MDLATFDWLLGDAGQRLLDRAAAELEGGASALELATSLRRDATAEQAAAAAGIAELRRHAAPKFGDDAARMYFTREALEQATRRAVANHRSRRLALGGAGMSVLDLGCGIGGDLTAMASAGLTAAGVDTDPLRVEMARANLDALGLGGAVAVADGTSLDLAPFGAVYVDPARRDAHRRSFSVDDWTPSWGFVTTLFDRAAVVKVAPGIDHDLIPGSVEGEWVSDRGDLKEAVLWCGPLASTARRATVIGDGGLATLTDEDPVKDEVRGVGEFLYEPDDAVIRAGLVTAVAAGVDGGLVDPKIAYVTSDAAYRTPFARNYRVVDELPYREKQLKAALRERGIGRLTIKKRGVEVRPEELRKRLGLRGDNEATVVLTRVADHGTALLVEPF